MTVEESRALTVAINSMRFNPNLDDIEVQGYEIALANMRNRAQDMDDTGLTPYEVERMKEYMLPFTIQDMDRFREIMQAEKDGRLAVLPCKVGDTVFAAETSPVIPLSVMCVCLYLEGANGGDWESLQNFGETVFLTREEADAALKDREVSS